MNRSWFSILLVVVLLGLLAVLATLQFKWLGQISDGERTRLDARLTDDTRRFAEDFNREIGNAYFNFQTDSSLWREGRWNEFAERYDFYKQKTAYPDLIKDFYFVEKGENLNLSKYEKETAKFAPAEWSDELNSLKPELESGNLAAVKPQIPALLMTVYDEPKIEKIIVRTPNTENIRGVPQKMPDKYGFLIVRLDEEVIKNKILPDLTNKYFGAGAGASYKIAVTNAENEFVFQTAEVNSSDATASFFNLTPDRFMFVARNDVTPLIENKNGSQIIFNKIQTQSQTKITTDGNQQNVEVQVIDSEQNPGDVKPRVKIFESNLSGAKGAWTLNVQHADGSLEQFIANTRNRNLAISFGIMSLLAVSVILIFLSANRAKNLAQKQMDFVSSVSHEFRTPLAVIHSAGENLSDGVVRDSEKISGYGNLIKREGKKLTGMVEQILEFAGARSGKRKYDFRETEIEKIIAAALNECQPLIDEKNFTVESEIAENLPKILVDEKAMTQAVQNLIVNSIKYSGENKWLKISATNGAGTLKIAVEDKGIGISAKEQKHIFEPFYRGKTVVSDQISGNGLGLSLVKQIANAHGGKVTIESETGKGSKFIVHLPLTDK